MGQLTRLFDVVAEILLERHIAVFRAVFLVEQLHFAERRAERRNVESIYVFQVSDARDLRLAELHYIFDALSRIDKPQRVVRQPQRREGRKLLLGPILVRRSAAETRQDYARLVVHAKWLV